MKVDGKPFRTVWVDEDDVSGRTINVIDQRHLPHTFVVEPIKTAEQMATAIRDMHVRGAGCVGACAAAGMWLAAVKAPRSDGSAGGGGGGGGSGDLDSSGGGGGGASGADVTEEGDAPNAFDAHMQSAAEMLLATRPTAVTLEHAVTVCRDAMRRCEEQDYEGKMLVRVNTLLSTGRLDGVCVGRVRWCNQLPLAFVMVSAGDLYWLTRSAMMHATTRTCTHTRATTLGRLATKRCCRWQTTTLRAAKQLASTAWKSFAGCTARRALANQAFPIG